METKTSNVKNFINNIEGGSEEVPGQAWVVEAGVETRTWRSVGRASTFSTSSSSTFSTSTNSSSISGKDEGQPRRGPLAVCAGRAGLLWALYPRSGRAPQVWLLPYTGPPNWQDLPTSPHTTHPHHTAPVLAHWCGTQHTWLLTGPSQGHQDLQGHEQGHEVRKRQEVRQEQKEGQEVRKGQEAGQGQEVGQGQEDGPREVLTEGYELKQKQRETQGPKQREGHSLWRLDEQRRWTSVSVMGWTGGADQTLITWGGLDEEGGTKKEEGGLYLLQRREEGDGGGGGEKEREGGGGGVGEDDAGKMHTVRVIRIDADSGTWRTVDITGQHPLDGLWLPGPGPQPHLYLVHSAPGSPGFVLTTIDYITGTTIASRTLQSPCHPSPLHLALLNGVLVPGMPSCVDIDGSGSSSWSPATPPPPPGGTEGGGGVDAPTSILTLPTLALTDTCALSSSSSSSSSRSSLEHGPPRPSDHSHIPTVVSGGKKLGAPPPSPSDNNNNHDDHNNNNNNNSIKEQTYNRVIFFSLSLSIFALVGLVIFVRRCVRCPPTREIGEGRDGVNNQRGTPSSPLPVLYSIVSEDVNYDTSANTSPCPSHNALYDATLTTSAVDTPSATTPDGTTPNYMTPDSMTPSNLSPSKEGLFSRHSLIPSSFSSDAVTRAITGTTTHAIGIATSPTIARHLPYAIINKNTNTLPRDHTTTTQF
ncbi:hypothetical protein Pmani_034258 [Petrolisthes manimaculis]|uniref:Uncharacterized protein n=1 Tax=Petrolisthes manimaculis TaxID=1843537 RepID=A0AAE1NN29_9EUCA|nr:hypothetical protein Pmani_034258 [Petrolisthes manimaculis]